MEPTSPVLYGYREQEIPLAKNQPQYKVLPVLPAKTEEGALAPSGIRLSRWTLTHEERLQIMAGADILLLQYTFNEPLQPVAMIAIDTSHEWAVAEAMGLKPDA